MHYQVTRTQKAASVLDSVKLAIRSSFHGHQLKGDRESIDVVLKNVVHRFLFCEHCEVRTKSEPTQ